MYGIFLLLVGLFKFTALACLLPEARVAAFSSSRGPAAAGVGQSGEISVEFLGMLCTFILQNDFLLIIRWLPLNHSFVLLPAIRN